MARDGWHILRDEDGLTLARHLPARFDVSVEAEVPLCDAGRLARQVRQDMWRAMQRVRGFSPVVRVERLGDVMRVSAGGRVPAEARSDAQRKIADVLEDGRCRARWVRWAGACKHTSTLLALFLAVPVLASEPLEVPSGQPVTFQEMLWDRPGSGLVYRFRFVAPEIGQEGREYEDVEIDMHHLCETYAIPRLSDLGPQPSQIVISLSREETEFGVAHDDVTQFFEAYRVEDETCILEFF
ncbi:hypothetical protein GCM10011363_10400 [Marivita lacus]|uniref:Uncharacterized protein n=1 Tax=Marivita lacus TaxID=1323742 RepID=A0ABQ1KCF1_9RHOB|nr:DUF6497 family protein [Marivita lacus]GGB95626.1 hypothetical protein GCM10011363_10400 [Marivita lacus]